jgi:hypothetical protein
MGGYIPKSVVSLVLYFSIARYIMPDLAASIVGNRIGSGT